jgi:hypothetical protein
MINLLILALPSLPVGKSDAGPAEAFVPTRAPVAEPTMDSLINSRRFSSFDIVAVHKYLRGLAIVGLGFACSMGHGQQALYN